VFAGEPQPIDTEPVRRAAVMRVRVAAALATAPAPGGDVDQGAVSAFLGDIDALLSDVNALAAGAPPDVQASLETMRNALVKEAIDFSEAVQHAAPAGALVPAALAAPRARATQTRVVSVATQAEAEIAQAEDGRRRRVLLAFAAVAAATFAFHGYNTFVKRRPAVEPPALSGIPANADVAVPDRPGMPATVHSRDGAALAPADVARLKESEALKGNVVKEVGPGVVVVIPGAPLAAPPPRAGGR
jgi:hypothetical protein